MVEYSLWGANMPYDADTYLLKAVNVVGTRQGRLIDNLSDLARELFIEDELKRISFLMRELRNKPDNPIDDVEEGE